MNQNVQKNQTKAQLILENAALSLRIAELEAAFVELRKELETLRENQTKYQVLLDESSDPVFSFFPDGEYRYVNKAFANGVGRNVDSIIGKKIWDVFPKEEAEKRFAVVKWVFENGKTHVFEVRVPRPDGDRYYITTVKPIFNEQSAVISVICISKEITERKRIEQELVHLSSHDLLTGLYNRNFFEVELIRLQGGRSFPQSILIADVDNLKVVNDNYGHAAGDDLLRSVARIFHETFRAEDIIARIGGDEFAVLLPNTDASTAQSITDRLRNNLEFQQNRLLQLSIGVATGGEGCRLAEIMRIADDRMYQEKHAHRLAS